VTEQLAIAKIGDNELHEAPKDLYIPPHALRVFLASFEGPLDLLLYLIRKQNLNIVEINVAQITSQYMEYIGAMESLHFELAAEYLVMAATLAEIKSRMLLPRSDELDDEEEDPRALLIKRLQEYERFKKSAEDLDTLPRVDRDILVAEPQACDYQSEVRHPDVSLDEISIAFAEVLRRASMFESHQVSREELSTRERMAMILDRLQDANGELTRFSGLFEHSEGRAGVVVTFLAIMELVKESLLDFVQNQQFGELYVKLREGDGLSYEY